MALIDEDKLQGNVFAILQLLRKEQTCCGYINGQFMCDGSTVVWVLTSPTGAVKVFDAPGGTEITPAGALGPVTSGGICP